MSPTVRGRVLQGRNWCRARPRILAAVAVLGVVGCADDGSNGRLSVVTRDSAGVEIAEVDRDPWTAPVWATIDTMNVFRIVPENSRPETLFGRVRGALRLHDGRIAVLDIGRYRVQFFASDGTFLRSRGRQGQGPGELAQPWRLIRVPGDSVAVYDMEGRLELMSAADDGSRRIRVLQTRDGAPAQILGSFANGDYLAVLNEFPGKMQPGTLPLFSTIRVMDTESEPGASLGRHQSGEFTFEEVNGRLRQVETFFWAEPGMAVLPTGFAWCLTTRFDCQIWSREGRHVRTLRAPVAAPPVTDDDIEQVAQMRLSDARTAADTIGVRTAIRQAHRTERFPIASLIRADSRGRIWMRPFVWRPSEQAAHWIVFEQDGTIRGRVHLPTGLQVFDIGDDYVLGTQRGVDDVEEVVMYRYEVR